MAGKITSSSMPVLKKSGKEAVLSKVFQDVHNAKLLGEEILELRDEFLLTQGWKMTCGAESTDVNSPVNMYFSFR